VAPADRLRPSTRDRITLKGGPCHTEKLVPHPHDAVALGLATLNDAPIRSSTKSISAPSMYLSDIGSMRTTAPLRSMTRSSSATSRSTSNLYWKPEQPPPSTLTRSIVPGGSLFRISPIRRAARSLTLTAVVIVPLRPPTRLALPPPLLD